MNDVKGDELLQSRACTVWVVEFSAGVEEGQRKKMFLTEVGTPADVMLSILRASYPNTKFTIRNVDSGVLTLPEAQSRGDFLYQHDSRQINEKGEIVFIDKISEEPVFNDERVITFKPPGMNV